MMFPVDLTCALTGATRGQLTYWRRSDKPVLRPEFGSRPRAGYSFRDLIAVRSFVKLRQEISLQKIRQALLNMPVLDFADHPSTYRMAADGSTIFIAGEDGRAVDVVRRPGDRTLFTFSELFDEFEKKDGERVVNFLRPRSNVIVNPRRIGGWPTAGNTRVPYDAVASLMATGEVPATDVKRFYPTVSEAAAHDAFDFARQVAETAA